MRRPEQRLVFMALALATFAGACDGGGGDDGASGPVAALEVVALDTAYEDPAPSVAAGEVEITLVQRGNMAHDFVVEGRPEIRLEVNPGDRGATDTGVYEFDPGTYTFFCTLPGHRAAGMEGVLTVTG